MGISFSISKFSVHEKRMALKMLKASSLNLSIGLPTQRMILFSKSWIPWWSSIIFPWISHASAFTVKSLLFKSSWIFLVNVTLDGVLWLIYSCSIRHVVISIEWCWFMHFYFTETPFDVPFIRVSDAFFMRVIVLVVLVVFCVSIGYAAMNRTLNITGNSEIKKYLLWENMGL